MLQPPPTSPRPSRLGELLRQARIERARRMSPQERLLLALDMSDLCLDLHHACSVKP
jgi:hypothetical protein